MKKRYIFLLFLLGLVVLFFLGPKPDFPKFDGRLTTINASLDQLDRYIAAKEAQIPNIKPNNQSRIVWADSIRKTPYSLVYLHGFSASPMEGDPLHFEFAKRYGFNLYLPRLAGHGLDEKEAFKDLTPKDLVESAKEAISIGKLLGEKVILMSCSTGGTLGIYLAASNPDDVAAQILYSPNIDIYDQTSHLMTGSWGGQIAHLVLGDYYSFVPPKEEGYKYWTTRYRVEGLICLRALLDNTMKEETFQKIKHPFFLGYYYKTEEDSDHVVSIDAMKDFFAKTSTPDELKQMVALPNVGNHALLSRILSKDVESVREETFAFAEGILGLEPVESTDNYEIKSVN